MEHSEKLLLRSSPSEDVTPEMGIILGQALALYYDKVVVGRDLMQSSPMMKNALVSGLVSSGTDVIDIGEVSEPVAGLAASMGDCCVYVTEFRQQDLMSGYLLIEKDGSFFSMDQVRRLDRIFEVGRKRPPFKELGTVKRYYNAINDYNMRLMALSRSATGGSLVLDCNCGLGTDSAPQILNKIGTDIISINAQKDSEFISNPLSIKEADTRHMKALVLASPGSTGISMNRVGTMMRVFDETGEPITDEQLLCLFILYLKPKKVVVPMDVTWLIEDVFRGNVTVEVDSPFPDPDPEQMEFVVANPSVGPIHRMLVEKDADLTYYQGGFVFKGISWSPDAIMGSVLLSQFSSSNNMSEVLSKLPTYFSEKKTFKFSCSQADFARMMDANLPDINPMAVYEDKCWRVDMASGGFFVAFDKDQEDVVNIFAESNDKLYLISLLEVIDGLMEKCEAGQ